MKPDLFAGLPPMAARPWQLPAMPWILRCLAGCAVLVFTLGCAGCQNKDSPAPSAVAASPATPLTSKSPPNQKTPNPVIKPDPQEKSEKPTPDWSKVGASYQDKDLKITLHYAICGLIVQSEENGIPVSVDGPYVRVKLTVENTSATKIIRWAGWQNNGTATDEHGNRIDFIRIKGVNPQRGPDGKPDKDLWGDKDLDDVGGAKIEPKTTYTTLIYLEKIPTSSRELRVSFPASTFEPGSMEKLYFRLPVTHQTKQ